jgi:hypothetical protein
VTHIKSILAGLLLLSPGAWAVSADARTVIAGTSTYMFSLPQGAAGYGLSFTAGLKGTVKVQVSFDRGATFTDDPSMGPLYFATTSTVLSLGGPLPPGATNVQVAATSYTTGSTTVSFRVTEFTGPARATVSGTLSASGDYIAIPVDPTRWGTVRTAWLSGAAGVTVTAKYSTDGGTNWLDAPYGKRTDSVSPNPTTSAYVAVALNAGWTAEFPLPGGATHFRFAVVSPGSASTISISTGAPYTPGNPTVATLTDASSTFNGVLDVSLDTSGWKEISYFFTTPTTSGMGYYAWQLDDTGATSTIYTASTATQTIYGALGSGTTLNTGGGNVTTTSGASMPRRLLLRSTAIAGYQTRIRVEGRR